MERITAREYARRNKLSLFQVIKKLQNGELNGEQVEENGLKIQYVFLDEDPGVKRGRSGSPSRRREESNIDRLERELGILRREVERLQKMMEHCCKKKK